jgi:hypothetical protein
MNPPNKKWPETKPPQGTAGQQTGYAKQSPSAVARTQQAAPASNVRRPAAPPVLRPLSKPNGIQPKTTGLIQRKTQPVIPPVYRPQPVPKVLQSKKSQHQQSSVQPSAKAKGPAAPPPYRPQPTLKVLQTRKAGVEQPYAGHERRPPLAHSANRPQSAPRSIQPAIVGRAKPPLAIPPNHLPHTPSLPRAINPTSAAPLRPSAPGVAQRKPAPSLSVSHTEMRVHKPSVAVSPQSSTTIQRTKWGTLGLLAGAYIGAIPGALVGGLVGSVVDYLTAPPTLAPVQQQPPSQKQIYRQELAESKRHFSEKGRPLYRPFQENYPHGMHQERWEDLTSLGDIPKVKKKARIGKPQAIHSLIKYLFRKFTTYGFNYELMSNNALYLLDTNYASESAEGNCRAYATAFAQILNSFGIDAKAKAVRGEEQGRFIVKVNDFIDPKVKGHIYEKGNLKQGYYMFSSHFATWIPSEQKFYDPMSKASYISLAPFIECEMASNENETVFWPKTVPKTLAPHYKWKLIMQDEYVPGGFNRQNLVPFEY